MKRIFIAAVFLTCFSLPAAFGGYLNLLGAGSPPQSGSCTPGTAASTFLARTTGLSGTETTAYCNLINGLVADGTWTKLDALYIFATNTTTTANLNLVSTSFGLTVNGTVTFSADHGYTGGGAATDYINTGYTPSTAGGVWTLNNASIGVYVLTNRTASANITNIGGLDASNDALLQLNSFGSFDSVYLNSSTLAQVASTTSQGFWGATRTASNAAVLYRNNSGTPLLSTAASGAGASPTVPIYILALNNNGTAAQNTTDQTSAAFIGGGLASTDFLSLSSRINTFMTALGINVY